MKTAIIIPFLNKWELTHKRLMEIYTYVKGDIEIILIDDCSTDVEVAGGVAWWQKTFKGMTIRYKKNKEHKGFGQSMNEGARIALKYNAELLVFLSNDVVVSGNFLPEVINIVEKDYKVLIGGEVIRHAAGWNEHVIDGNKYILPWANGWFLACTDVIWQSLGGFDPIYYPTDYEDVDLSTTAIDLGYNLVALNSIYLQHLGAQTAGYTQERMERTKKHQELYKTKWLTKIPNLHQKILLNL